MASFPIASPIHSPSQLSSELQRFVHEKLEALLTSLKNSPENSLHPRLRIRDWSLVLREHQPFCEVFLDKGHSWLQYDDFASHPAHAENCEIVTIDECLVFHRALAQAQDLMDLFADSVGFEVGSAGEEPPLRTREDFEHAKGLMVRIQTWTKSKKKDKHKGRLIDVLEDPQGAPVAVIESGGNPVQVELADLRRASLLLFHPENFSTL